MSSNFRSLSVLGAVILLGIFQPLRATAAYELRSASISASSVLHMAGTGSHWLPHFHVSNFWSIDWRYGCEGLAGSSPFLLLVYRYKPSGLYIVPSFVPVHHWGHAEHGTALLGSGGTFLLHVLTRCSWSLSIRQR